MKIIENENEIISIEFGNIAFAKFYDKPTLKLTKTISFKTIKLKPKRNISSIERNGSSFIVQSRQHEEGHTVRTSLKDILSYLDGVYEGGLTEKFNSKYKTTVKFLKEE
tara:strand:- start:1557 stop:1883 length:327 start_codon:yes stop_codon:yes gene_type:complete